MGLEGLIRVILAFACVVILMLVIAWIVRKLGLEKRFRSRLKREGAGVCVEDIFYIDPKRRLVTVARGNKKHLLLLGPHADMVVEHFEEEAAELVEPSEGSEDET